MKRGRFAKRKSCFLLGILLVYPPALLCASSISLQNAAIILEAGEASYVHHAVEELRHHVERITGKAPVLCYRLQDVSPGAGALVVVGRGMTARFARDRQDAPAITDREPGPQGFLLKTLCGAGRPPVVIASGSDSIGTNYALLELRQRLLTSRSGVSVWDSLDVRETPATKVRGLYLHQHWRYKHPYAAWSWSVEDWKHAFDIAAFLRVNLVLLWPHMDMIAPPLSVAEQSYLADVREIVEYARRKRGIEVWLVEPANVLLDSTEIRQLPMERRDYYAWAHSAGTSRDGRKYRAGPAIKNPGDPTDFAALMANREALYRGVPNADGYGYIDMDPGGYPDSPSSQFVDLFVENRKLLDRHHERPREAKLFYWIAGGWGRGTKDENVRETLAALERRLPGPWELLFYPAHAATIRGLGYESRAILFPYNIIEREPSLPLTNLNFEAIRKVDVTGWKGLMANSQSYLLQLPNLFHFLGLAWSRKFRALEDAAILDSLASLLYIEQHDLLALGWAQLQRPGSREASVVERRILEVVHGRRIGRLGIIGEAVFPDPDQVLRDLAAMLRIHSSAEAVRELAGSGAPEKKFRHAIVLYLRELLEWRKVNGFFGAYAVNGQVIFDKFNNGLDARVVSKAWASFVRGRPDREALESDVIEALLSAGYTDWIARSMAGQMFGSYREKGEFDMDVASAAATGSGRR